MVKKKGDLYEFAQQPIPLTVAAIILGIIAVRYFTPLLVVCEGVLIYDFYRYGKAHNKEWRRGTYLAFICITCGLLIGARLSVAHMDQPSVIVRPATEEERLCSRPLQYSLRELPKPIDNNYSTELTVKNSKELMLTVDIYTRTLYSQASITYPPDAHDQVIALELNVADLSHLRLGATKGVAEFRLEIHTFQPLRLKCVNQTN
jgi:hypothetical protein